MSRTLVRVKGDRVEVLVDIGESVRQFEVVATKAGRRVEVSSGRGMIEVVEVTRTGQPVRSAVHVQPGRRHRRAPERMTQTAGSACARPRAQDLIEGHSPCPGHAAGLDPCVRHRDLRIETRAGRGDRVDRHVGPGWEPVLPAVLGDALAHTGERLIDVLGGRVVLLAVEQLRARRPEVRGAARQPVVPVACRRGPRVEVLGLGEALPDERRPDHLAVGVLDERPVGPLVERDLADAGDDERIGDPQHERQRDRHEQSGDELAAHHFTPRETTRSMSLMPTNGATMPPNP